MTTTLDTASPWGTYAPNRAQRLVMAVARHSPIARGFLRKRIALRVGHDGPLDVHIFGLKVRCFPSESASERRALMDVDNHDRHERDTILQAAGAVASGDRFHFVDLGANTGFYTLDLAARAPDARVLALEPVSHYVDIIDFNKRTNALDGVTLQQVAVSDKEGTALFDPVDQSLAQPHLNSPDASRKPYEVRTATLTQCLAEAQFDRIDALKIDVEGYEDVILFRFFEEAPQSLWPKLVVIEHICANAWQRDCLQLLEQNGYTPIWKGRLNTIYVRNGASDG